MGRRLDAICAVADVEEIWRDDQACLCSEKPHEHNDVGCSAVVAPQGGFRGVGPHSFSEEKKLDRWLDFNNQFGHFKKRGFVGIKCF